MTHYNTTRNGITSWKEFKGRPSTIDWLRSIPAMVLIFLIGAIGHKRKKPKQIKPMGTHLAYVPPSYKYQSATPIDPSKISERIKAYTVNGFEGLQVCRTKDGPMQYLPSEKVSEISYNIKNQLTA